LPLTLAPITAAPAKVTKCQYLHQTKHVCKGAKPGIAIYKQERILWGSPAGHEFIKLAGQSLADFRLIFHLEQLYQKHVNFIKKFVVPVTMLSIRGTNRLIPAVALEAPVKFPQIETAKENLFDQLW